MEDKVCSAKYYIDMLFYQWRVCRNGEVLSYHSSLNEAKRELNKLRKRFCGYNSKYQVRKEDLYD